jgi:hypothetical protein
MTSAEDDRESHAYERDQSNEQRRLAGHGVTSAGRRSEDGIVPLYRGKHKRDSSSAASGTRPLKSVGRLAKALHSRPSTLLAAAE